MSFIIVLILGLLLLAGSTTIFIYIYDGYKQNNLKKGILYVLAFFGLFAIFKILLDYFGIWLAMASPLLLVLFLVVSYFARKQ